MDFFSYLWKAPQLEPRPSMDTQLIGKRLTLRMGDPADWRAWRYLRDMSRDFLIPWEPQWSHKSLDYNFFCGVLRRNWREWRHGKAYAFYIFLQDQENAKGAFLGCINLNDVQYGIARKATLGYWIGKPYAGQGYMTEASQLVCDFAFDALKLHRVEASCLPHNEPSKALLKRLGFDEEGYAKEYLQINGRWEDHLLWGKVRPSSHSPCL